MVNALAPSLFVEFEFIITMKREDFRSELMRFVTAFLGDLGIEGELVKMVFNCVVLYLDCEKCYYI